MTSLKWSYNLHSAALHTNFFVQSFTEPCFVIFPTGPCYTYWSKSPCPMNRQILLFSPINTFSPTER